MQKQRARTVLGKDAYDAIGKAANESRPKPWTPESVQFVHQGARRMLEFFFQTNVGGPVSFGFPIDWIDELKGARLADLKTARLSPSHTAIIVDGVDAFISVEGLFRDFATRSPSVKALMVHTFAATGGKTTSDAKKRASAENGRKGGRPAKKRQEHAVASGKAKR
ncbi:MAG TPA: DUF2442 domain-containing protein [Ramlibacter sp.]|uniref:DUF2442 domain-containing protein n=1 Tax=Ramlibacter sp. TaxID=1917967 RepID=UPI002BE4DE60|nr:DUF2442 domain-containing protein [Ramlibacter sp.]HVZ46891.1 DUF2442 domain-containing protein [Ramlibacter sp.]